MRSLAPEAKITDEPIHVAGQETPRTTERADTQPTQLRGLLAGGQGSSSQSGQRPAASGYLSLRSTRGQVMHALTICQPYAHLIVTPARELPRDLSPKRIENRRWHTSVRGPLLIHAGKSHNFLWPTALKLLNEASEEAGSALGLSFGAILGIAELVDCIPIQRKDLRDPTEPASISAADRKKYPWVVTHQHSEGPNGLILANVRRFRTPISWGGSQGFWFVPDRAVETALINSDSVPMPWETATRGAA